MSTHKVFVYGTLRREEPNHYLLENHPFLGEAISMDDFIMWGSRVPFIREAEGKHALPIRGEIFEVPHEYMPRLDALEGHPRWYLRKEKTFRLNGEKVTAWVYTMPEGDPSGLLEPKGAPSAYEANRLR